MANVISASARWVADAALKALKKALGIQGTSRMLFEQMGRDIQIDIEAWRLEINEMEKGVADMARTYAVRDAERSAKTKDLISALAREGLDVIRYPLEPRYTGYDVILCRQRDNLHWHMIAIPNGDHISGHMANWLLRRDETPLLSDSIMAMLRWIGVEQ